VSIRTTALSAYVNAPTYFPVAIEHQHGGGMPDGVERPTAAIVAPVWF
jgi:hypothetical protein